MDTERYRDLFVAEARGRLRDLSAFLAAPRQDARQAAVRDAHTIRGMAATMQVHPIAELAGSLEAWLHRGVAANPATQAWLARVLERLAAQVEAYAAGEPVPGGSDLAGTLDAGETVR